MQLPPAQRPEDSLVTTAIGRGGLTARQLRILILLAIMLVTTIAGTVYLINLPVADGVPSANLHPPIKATVPILPQGESGTPMPIVGAWEARSDIQGIRSVASLTQAPSTTYACAVKAGQGYAAFSADSGLNWEIIAVIGPAATCRISINPVNPLDIVVLLSPCQFPACAGNAGWILYRSEDGGFQWQQVSTPMGEIFFGSVAWLGKILLTTLTSLGNTSSITDLALSVGDLPLQVIPPRPVSAKGAISDIFSGTNAFYVNIQPDGSASGACGMQPGVQTYALSTDGSQWQATTFSAKGQSLALSATTAGGELVGVDMRQNMYLSPDAGNTWKAVLAPTSTTNVCETVVAHDGTLIENTQQFGSTAGPTPYSYLLNPLSLHWMDLTSSAFPQLRIFGVTYDTDGVVYGLFAYGYGTTAGGNIIWLKLQQ